MPSSKEKKANTDAEQTNDPILNTSPSGDSNEVSSLVEDLPDILDEEVEINTDNEEEKIAVIENNQLEDGSVEIPEVLRPYMFNFKKIDNNGNLN